MQVKKIESKKKMGVFAIVLIVIIVSSAFSINSTLAVKPPAAPVTLNPLSIPKYVNQLVVPPVFEASTVAPTYTISMDQTRQQVLPTGTILTGSPDGLTNVWGYKGNAIAKGGTLGVLDGTLIPNFIWSPSATFETTKGTPITVKWINNINTPQPFAVDPTLKWANPNHAFPEGDIFSATGGPFPAFPPGYDGIVAPNNPLGLNAQSPVALVPHLHGAEVSSYYDGGPDAWWTSTGQKGLHYYTDPTVPLAPAETNAAVYSYPNAQEPNTLWYHDHALGITRINVMSGLAGFYMLRNTPVTVTGAPTTATFDEYLTQTFPYGISEIPIAIQDRTFKPNGEFFFPAAGINPTVHPYWIPEFFGDTIMVNGMVWPNLDVTPGWYRLRLLDGSNARFYTLSFSTGVGTSLPFYVIGADGGYLQKEFFTNTITIAPGERADILIQIPTMPENSKITLTNTANAPFPVGLPADPLTTGQIMQFTVKSTTTNGVQGATINGAFPFPTTGLNPTLPTGTFPTLQTTPITKRYITLVEVMGPKGPVMVLINGQYYDATVTETPKVGTEEDWVIINLTADTHPIHTHLVTFQLVSRDLFNKNGVTKYTNDWTKLQVDPLLPKTKLAPPFPRTFAPISLDPTPYLSGVRTTALPTEMGWKDTIQMHPGEVTTIRVRFTSQDGSPFSAAINPTVGPGYVYHCHILDHEDNEMMRPFVVLP